MSDAEKTKHVGSMIRDSRRLRDEAMAAGLPFIDTGRDFLHPTGRGPRHPASLGPLPARLSRPPRPLPGMTPTGSFDPERSRAASASGHYADGENRPIADISGADDHPFPTPCPSRIFRVRPRRSSLRRTPRRKTLCRTDHQNARNQQPRWLSRSPARQRRRLSLGREFQSLPYFLGVNSIRERMTDRTSAFHPRTIRGMLAGVNWRRLEVGSPPILCVSAYA